MAQSIITIRRAQPQDQTVLQDIYADGGGVVYDWLDWSSSAFYWLIGEVNGVPQGIVMALPGCPFGQVDFLYVRAGVSRPLRARLSRDLAFAGVEYCAQHGASAICSTIRTDEPSWLRIAQRRGWVPITAGTFLLKRT